MQSLEASKHYKNSLVCATRIVKDEGVFTLWSGAMPRLARLIMSGGIVFTMLVPASNTQKLVANYFTGMKRLWML
jgi:solute carrier family 25 citrate transporter 1